MINNEIRKRDKASHTREKDIGLLIGRPKENYPREC